MREQVSDTVGGDWSKLRFLSGASKYGRASPVSQVMSCVTLFHRYMTHCMGGIIIVLYTWGKEAGPGYGNLPRLYGSKVQGQVSNLFFRAELLILPLHFVASQAHVSSWRLPWRGEMPPWRQTHHATAKHSGAHSEQWWIQTVVSWASPVAQMVKNLHAVWDTRVWSLHWEDPPEKGLATPSSTLAWKIPWTEEPGGLLSMGSLRVGHDWATSLSLFTFMHWRRKWQPTPVLLPGESQGWGSLVGCRLWGRTESDTTEVT